jgi:chromosome segregation ATPase
MRKLDFVVALDNIGAVMTDERSRLEVLVEDVQRHLKVLAEAHIATVDHLGRIDRKLEKLDELEIKFDVLDKKVDVLDKKVDVLDKKVDVLDKKVDALDERVGSLEVFASDAKQQLKGLETKVDKLDAFASDGKLRLKRIEAHLELKRPIRASRHRSIARAEPVKSRKKS